jgi:tRNA threonylcarbamoyl adenosine modification protein YeaZ
VNRTLTLVLNAAEERLQIVLARGGEPLCAQDWVVPARGTEVLAPALESMFSCLRLSFSGLERIACVRGPGSFTGIRLVLATAAALARAGGALLAGIDYMQALAQDAALFPGAARADRPRHIHVLTHARRDLVHARLFAAADADVRGDIARRAENDAPRSGDVSETGHGLFTPIVRPLSELAVLSPESCARRVEDALSSGARVTAAGGAWTLHERLASLLERLDCPPPRRNPSAEALLALALHAEYGTKDIEACYARPCDAEANLGKTALRRGEDPVRAEERLKALLRGDPGDDGTERATTTRSRAEPSARAEDAPKSG